MSVPTQYIGLWKRVGIWRRDGSSDETSPVYWFQGEHYHIDIRMLPQGPTGFAGTTVVAGARCEWQPAFAYPTLSGELDAGIMRFDADDLLHEDGIDGSYQEDWVKIADGPVREQRSQDGVYTLESADWSASAQAGAIALRHRGELVAGLGAAA
jgi:hypothetical protein